MELDHADAKAQAEYTQANSNMARCYLDLAKQVAKLQNELTQQKECYRIVAKNLMTYSKITKEIRSRIAELEANFSTMQQMEEQHLLFIDQQSACIKELEAELAQC